MLAARLLLEQGVEVVAVTFTSPFFGSGRGERAAALLGIPHRVVDIGDELVECVRAPKHGYGRHANPCIDCHALMVRVAASMMEDDGAAFVATGEVLGERPKSQRLDALRIVEEESGLAGRLLRPLSAKLLDETIPEKEGLVDRERLEAIKGRSRKRQFELAAEFGITEYPTPGGGCRLTEGAPTARIRALLERHPDATKGDFELVGLGRHIWEGAALVVVGRDHADNMSLENEAQPGDSLIRPRSGKGPVALVRWPTAAAEELAASAVARYGQERDEDQVSVVARTVGEPGERPLVSSDHKARRFALVGA